MKLLQWAAGFTSGLGGSRSGGGGSVSLKRRAYHVLGAVCVLLPLDKVDSLS
jgi:hypothetical protein